MVPNGLQYRKETKYILNYSEYFLLSGIIRRLAQVDRNAADDGMYRVRSLYFDDMYNSAYIDKKIGLPNRYKFRIRSYNLDPCSIKLEKKYKLGDLGSKESDKLTQAEYADILNGGITISDSSSGLQKAFYIDTATKNLKPKVIVDYMREAFVWQIGTEYLRFTFDSKLKWAMDSLDILDSRALHINAFEDDRYIFEIKYICFFPEIISDLLRQLDRFPSGSSKYQLCRKQKDYMLRR